MQTIVTTLRVSAPLGIDSIALVANATTVLKGAIAELNKAPGHDGVDIELTQTVVDTDSVSFAGVTSGEIVAGPKAPRKPRTVKAKSDWPLKEVGEQVRAAAEAPAPTLAEQVIAESGSAAPPPAWRVQADAAPAAEAMPPVPSFMKRTA